MPSLTPAHESAEGRIAELERELCDLRTRLRELEEARAHEENLPTIIESMHAAVLLKDGEGRWLIANEPMRRFMGVDDLDCIGQTDAELALQRPALAAAFAGCIASDEAAWAAGIPVRSEEHIPGPAGDQIFEVVKVPLFHPDGRRRGLMVVAEDTTERRLREAHLRERDAQFTALAAHAPGILYEFRREVDGSFSFPYISGNTRSLYGEGPEIFMRDAFALFYYTLEDDRPHFMATVEASLESMTTWQCDYRIRRKDGAIRWLRGASTPRRMEDGAVQWSGFIHDITQLKDTEAAELSRGKREVIERLAGGVAHDFNNYLTSIRVSAELLRELPDAPASVAELSESLLHEIDAAARVARQLLAFTKDQPLRHEKVKLPEFLAETAAFALRGSGISAQINVGTQDLVFETDPVLLQQVLFNLLINAREAMDGRGRIEIGAAIGTDGSARLRVGDNGPGIPLERQAHIFDPYFTSKPNGSGLGLHVVRSLLGRLGGEIRLDAAAPQGAAFDLVLPPRNGPLSPGPKTTHPSTPPTGGARGVSSANPHVLLLDDEEVQIWLLKRFLSVIGLTHEAFSDGTALIASAERQRESGRDIVCLLDITVKDGQGGLEIAQPLRAALPHARIILVSGYTDAWEERADSLSALNIRFIAKPYTLPDLREMILGPQIAVTA